MSMKVSTRHVDGVTILDLSGRITLGEGSVTLLGCEKRGGGTDELVVEDGGVAAGDLDTFGVADVC